MERAEVQPLSHQLMQRGTDEETFWDRGELRSVARMSSHPCTVTFQAEDKAVQTVLQWHHQGYSIIQMFCHSESYFLW